MSYQIIHNKEELLKYIDTLPELKEGEVYYCTLMSRSKYQKEKVSSNNIQLNQFTSTKEKLYNKIKKLEIPIGRYLYNNSIELPNESLALYINPNPRSLIKATKNSIVKLTKLILEEYNGYDPQRILMTEIQKACSRKVYHIIDIDDTEYDVNTFPLSKECYTVTKTRSGGYHIVVDIAKATELEKYWYNKVTAITTIDQRGDILTPVPGCINYVA